MEKDFLRTLEYAGFTARIKRLSDTLMYEARSIYDGTEIDIEPNWHLIFLLLKEEKELTVTEISKKLGFSHPAIIKITKKMKDQGYLEGVVDGRDSRKTLLRLSSKSLEKLPQFEQKWEVIQSIIGNVIGQDFLPRLAEVEDNLKEKNLKERFIEKNENNG